jgi:hypothetical protein
MSPRAVILTVSATACLVLVVAFTAAGARVLLGPAAGTPSPAPGSTAQPSPSPNSSATPSDSPSPTATAKPKPKPTARPKPTAKPSGTASARRAALPVCADGRDRCYTVRSGDSLTAIGSRFGVSLAEILRRNPALAPHPSSISVGLVVRLPSP